MVSSVWPVDAVSGAPNYSGRMGRQTAGALVGGKSSSRPLGGRSGVAAGTPSTVVSATSTVWTVGQCAGVIDAEASTSAGPYFWSNDANVTGAMTAADGSNPRIDLISVQISDPAESDGSVVPGIAFVYTTGVAAATPAAPGTPSRAFPLAQINVPRATFGSPTITDVAPRAVGAGGIVPTSGVSDYPATPYIGQYIDDDALGLLRWNGTAWANLTVAWKAREVSSLTTMPDAAFADVLLDTIEIDTASVGLTSGKFKCPGPGTYLVVGSVNFSNNVNGYRAARFTLNGSAIQGSQSEIGANTAVPHGTFLPANPTLVQCALNDIIALQGFQDTGGSTLALGAQSQLSILRV